MEDRIQLYQTKSQTGLQTSCHHTKMRETNQSTDDRRSIQDEVTQENLPKKIILLKTKHFFVNFLCFFRYNFNNIK